jgi:hypothetical protein
MSPRKPERAIRAKCTTMADAELDELEHSLKREIPAAQSLLAAVRKERKRRKAAAKKWEA